MRSDEPGGLLKVCAFSLNLLLEGFELLARFIELCSLEGCVDLLGKVPQRTRKHPNSAADAQDWVEREEEEDDDPHGTHEGCHDHPPAEHRLPIPGRRPHRGQGNNRRHGEGEEQSNGGCREASLLDSSRRRAIYLRLH